MGQNATSREDLKEEELHAAEDGAQGRVDMRLAYLQTCNTLKILPKASIVTRHRDDVFDLSG